MIPGQQIVQQIPLNLIVSNGLELLQNVSQLFIRQRINLTEAIFGFGMKAEFDIMDETNQLLFHAFEESDLCERILCRSARRYTLHIFNNNQQEIIQMHREFTLCAGNNFCSYIDALRQVITVESPPGQVIGTVSQEGSLWRMHYAIRDISGQNTLTIIGPCCIVDGEYSCCFENRFTLLGNDEITEIGYIHKEYSDFCTELCTAADNFTYEVPFNLDVRMKALVLAAVFVIDFSHFNKGKQER